MLLVSRTFAVEAEPRQHRSNLSCAASPLMHQLPAHLTSPTHTLYLFRYNPIKTIKTNFLGTMNMLGLAKRTRARFLISSTSEVYGDPVEHPQTESYWGNVNPIGERSCYDEGKRAAECLTMDYHREHGLEVRREEGLVSWRCVLAAVMMLDGLVALCSQGLTDHGASAVADGGEWTWMHVSLMSCLCAC